MLRINVNKIVFYQIIEKKKKDSEHKLERISQRENLIWQKSTKWLMLLRNKTIRTQTTTRNFKAKYLWRTRLKIYLYQNIKITRHIYHSIQRLMENILKDKLSLTLVYSLLQNSQLVMQQEFMNLKGNKVNLRKMK